jgi:hypothetical protein
VYKDKDKKRKTKNVLKTKKGSIIYVYRHTAFKMMDQLRSFSTLSLTDARKDLLLGLLKPTDPPDVTNIVREVLQNIRDQFCSELELSNSAGIWKRSLPYDTSNPAKGKILMLEMSEVSMSDSNGELLYRTLWESILPYYEVSHGQLVSMTAVLGVRGVGKTKLAYDIGMNYAFVVMMKIAENDILTSAWDLHSSLLSTVIEYNKPEPPSLVEKKSLVYMMIVIIAAYIDWIVEVLHEGEKHLDDIIDATKRTRDDIKRHLILRCQRNGLCSRHVAKHFISRMRKLISDSGILIRLFFYYCVSLIVNLL